MDENEKTTGDLLKAGLSKFGKRVAEIRKRRGLTQAYVANRLGITDSTISRVECGKCMPPRHILQAMFQLFGMPLDDVLSMLLDGGDYYEDDDFNDLREAIGEWEHDRLRFLLVQIDEKKLSAKGMYRQLYLYAKVLIEPEMDAHIAINRMVEALKITKRDFSLDNIASCRLSFNELTIINAIGTYYLNAGDVEKAARVFEDAAKSMDTYYLNERLKCEMYVGILCNLSTCYGRLGRFEEAESVCQSAKKLAVLYDRCRILPYLFNNIAMARFSRGDKDGYYKMIIQAYFTAAAVGKYTFAETIKIDAEDKLGIDLSVIALQLLELAGSSQTSDRL